MVGDSTRFTRLDSVEEAGGSCSRCSRPAAGARRTSRELGAGGGRELVAGYGAGTRPGSRADMDAYDVVIVGTGPGEAPWRGISPRPESGSSCSSAATGCGASRRTGACTTSSSTTATSRRTPGTTRRGRRSSRRSTTSSAARRSSTGCALPPAQGGLRRASAPRRDLAGLADLLRRARAVLHAGRAPVPGPRRAGRGPDRAAGQRSVPVPAGLARAADPAARRPARGRRASPVPRAVRYPPQRGESPRTAPACAA